MKPIKLFFIISLISVISCRDKGKKEILKYNELDYKVQESFTQLFDKVPVNSVPKFVDCISLDENCECIATRAPTIVGNNIKIESCSTSFIVPMTYLHRVFVIESDTLYIPNSDKGTMLKYGQPRSSTIKIDTISFIKFYGSKKVD